MSYTLQTPTNPTPTEYTIATVTRFKKSYKVFFQKHAGLSTTFKKTDNTRYDKTDGSWGWVAGPEALFTVMRAWKGNPTVTWVFHPVELKDAFYQQALVIRDQLREEAQQREALVARNQAIQAYKESLRVDTTFRLDPLRTVLRADTPFNFYYHQHIATAWLLRRPGGLLAAEMGLGKTLVFIAAALLMARPDEKVLIIAPRSLVLNIRNDLVKLVSDSWHFLGYDRKQPYTAKEARVLLMSYSYFASTKFDFQQKIGQYVDLTKIAAIACDESHNLKNPASLTFTNIKASFGKARIPFIMSSGTPVKSWGREIWTQLHLIDPVTFHSRTKFEELYCGAYMHPQFKRIEYDPAKEAASRPALHAAILPYMFRVRKQDVLDLPPKIYRKLVMPLSTSEAKDYNRYRNELIAEYEASGTEAAAMTLLLRLRQYTAAKKVEGLKELLERHLLEGEKVVVIDQHKEVLYELKRYFGDRAVVHTGDQSLDERQAAVASFQRSSTVGEGADIFLGSTATCRAGLTLTAGRILYMVTQDWTPADCDQVYDRVHRISQTRSVLIFIPVLDGTVDEYVYDQQEVKRTGMLRVIDNEGYAADMRRSMYHDVLQYLVGKTKSR